MYSNDQHVEFNRLPILLKRFAFDEKVRISHKYSRKAMIAVAHGGIEALQGLPMPWSIETFFLLSILSNEYGNSSFVGPNEQKFVKMINGIWGQIPAALEGESFADYFFPVTALTQFYLQEYSWYKYFRYNYFFSFQNSTVDFKKAFFDKFGCDYREYMTFGAYMDFLLSNFGTIPNNVLQYLIFERFGHLSKELLISREEYNEYVMQSVNSPFNTEELIYCLRPSMQYPFIEYQEKIYFPLPHLFIQSTTSSLLHRLTEGNSQLRCLFGKEVLEQYLISIICESNVYDEVYGEKQYIGKNKSEESTPDVLIRKGDDFLFLDAKALSPKKTLRLFDAKKYEEEVEISSKNIIKLYKHILDFPLKYNPFHYDKTIDSDRVWGAVVVLEDSYIRRSAIYECVKKMMRLDEVAYQWLTTHIKLVGLYEIEYLSFSSQNIISAFYRQIEEGFPGDYPFPHDRTMKYKITNEKIGVLQTEIELQYKLITDELAEKGLIPNN